jgi:hypothetical protein
MLFCERLSDEEWALAPRQERQRLLQEIMTDFWLSFPSLSFRLEVNSPLINAQAVTTVAGRHVNIYGGLAFHPKLGPDSLVLATLHEAGHHLSMDTRSPQNVTLACECAADFWSITEGAFSLRQRSGRNFQLDLALEEFSCILPDDLMSLNFDGNQLSECWSHGWSVRKKALLRRTPIAFSCCQK